MLNCSTNFIIFGESVYLSSVHQFLLENSSGFSLVNMEAVNNVNCLATSKLFNSTVF